jgi:hypothetical protein
MWRWTRVNIREAVQISPESTFNPLRGGNSPLAFPKDCLVRETGYGQWRSTLFDFGPPNCPLSNEGNLVIVENSVKLGKVA